MAVFTPRALSIPNMRTDYSAENSAFSNLGQTLGSMPSEFRKEQLNAQKQQLLGQLANGKADYNKVGLGLVALGDTQAGASLLSLGQKQQQLDAQKGIAGIFSGGASPAAAPAALGSPNEVENRFVSGVQKAGLTNPVGLGAVAAYGKSESGYDPGNVNKTWSDPSESGAAGTSGGIMSWRAERLQNLQNFARQRGETGNGSPETQAAFLAQEDPTLVPRLNAAKTPQEANQIMADAWRFAGYNRPGQGEFARRESLTSAYAQRYGSQPAAAQPVQVAETEADVQRLEQEQAARAAAAAPPAQVAQAPAADLPPQGANAAPAQAQGFAVPGNALPPNDPFPRVTTQQLYSILNNPGASPGQQAMAKQIIDNRQKYTDENAPDKREMTRLQTEELRQKVKGDNVRSLITPEERAAAGVEPGYKGTVQIDRQGRLTYPGKPTTEVKNEGTIPPGYRAVRDAAGNLERVEPIPGSKAEKEAQAASEKQQKAERIRAEVGTTVGNALDDIDRLMKSATLPTTGAVGSRLAAMPGTAAHDIAQALTTVGANISFAQLQQMREASPTGGALGAVSDTEQKLLQNSYAALSQSQSEEQFKTNLGRTRAVFERIVHGRTLTAQERKTGGPMTMERAKSLRDEAAAAIAGGADRAAVMKRLAEDYGISASGL